MAAARILAAVVVILGLCAPRHGDKHWVTPRSGLPRSVARRFDPEERYGLRVTLLAIALVLVGVPFGLLLDQVRRNGPLVRVDTWAANHLHAWVSEHEVAQRFLGAVSFLGSPPWFWALIAAAAAYWWTRAAHRRIALYLVLTGVLGGVISSTVKVLVSRDRPSLVEPIATAHGQSFPSGHAMLSVYGYGALLLAFLPLVPRRRRPALIAGWVVLAVLIGFSRLGLGVHYITDVLGGFVLGLAWLIASTAAFSIWRVERGKPDVEPEEGLEPEAARASSEG